jgi:4-hydroxy-3-polyprenylbenzoate decarboxylase
MDHVEVGEKADLLKFPTPCFHELDGGRYFVTCHAVIQKDPDSGFVNLGTYRIMPVDSQRLALHILSGHHGSIIMNKKYFARGKKMPVAVALGLDPDLWYIAFTRLSWGESEYDCVGSLRGEPIEVVQGEYTEPPIPAHAEIVIEEERSPDVTVDEGPFGEWHGYYGNLGLFPVPEPVIEVKAVYYRHDPIMTCQLPARPSLDSSTLPIALSNSSAICQRLEANGLPGIREWK